MILTTKNCTHLAAKLAKFKRAALLKYQVKQFADGEYYYRLHYSKKPKTITLLANITPDPGSLFELLALAQAAQDSGIIIGTLCIPYLGYSRQDRQSARGEAVMARMIANTVNHIPAQRRIFIDLHSDAVRAMFAPHDEIFCLPFITQALFAEGVDVVVAPDKGATARARQVAGDAPVIVMLKHRPRHNVVGRVHMLYPVQGKRVLMVDDMIDTGRTIASAARVLKKQGAESIIVAATHGVFSAPSYKILSAAPIDKILVSDTLSPRAPLHARVVSIARHLSAAL
ncbi:MAG: ribose-phosphate diphosphokinase [Pseudomonadota bacterium]